MEKKHTHEEFGELKARYTQVKRELEHIVEQMRGNLISRNDGSTEVTLYGTSRSVDVTECDLQDLYAADNALKSIKGV